MARNKLPEHQILKDVPAKLLPETIEVLRKIADKHEWSMSKVVRKAVEKGLDVWIADLDIDQARVELLSIKD